MARRLLHVLMAMAVALGVAMAQAPASLSVPATDSMVVGALAIDGVAQGTLVASSGGVAFHTFWFDVPAGVARWTLTLDADADLDLAVKAGSEIGTYVDRDRGGDWDFRDVETRNPTVLAIDAPTAGRWYVDVFNALPAGTRGSYRLTSSVGATAAPAAPGGLPSKAAPAVPSSPVPVVTAPTTESAVVGALPLEGVAQGTLVAATGGHAFHTYWVDVPAGVARWTLRLEADVDLDLALKYGAEIQNYSDRDRGGDWDARDIDTTDPTVLVVDAPQAGRWFVDVFSLLQPGTRGTYRLTSSGGGSPGAASATPSLPAAPGGSTPPAAFGGGSMAAAGPFSGSFRLQGGDVTLQIAQDASGQIRGSLAGTDVQFTVEGVTDADGTYGIIYDDEGGMYFSAVATGTGLELTLYDADAQGEAIPSSARTLTFDRVGAAPGTPPLRLPTAPPGGGALPTTPPTTAIAPPESGAIHDARPGLALAAGDRVRYPYVGASLTVPTGWQAWVADERLLPLYVASTTLPGMAVVLPTHGVALAQFALVLNEAIELEEGAVLRPVAAPETVGDQVSVRYAAATGVGVGVARTAGGAGAILLYIGGAGQEAVGAELLGALAASLRVEAAAAEPVLQRLQQDWNGYRMWTYAYGGVGSAGSVASTSGEFEASWDLCADGRFAYESRSERTTFAGTVADTGLSLGVQFFGGVDASAWSGRGRWTFAAIGDRPVLLLFDDAGSWSYYEVGWADDGSYRIDEFWLERRAVGGC